MKALTLALLLSLPVPKVAPPAPVQAPTGTVVKRNHKGGKWYFADSGHAVYCYGPVMFITQPTGQLKRVATFCQNNQPMVPLKD